MATIIGKEQKPIKEQLSEEDILDMAKYIAYLENENRTLIEKLKEVKSSLLATVQQRNSLNYKLRDLMNDNINTINIESSPVQTDVDLINPEQYQIEQYKPKKK